MEDEKYRQMLVNALVNKIFLFDDKVIIYFNATDKEPIEITKELREKVESGDNEGSYRTAMAED